MILQYYYIHYGKIQKFWVQMEKKFKNKFENIIWMLERCLLQWHIIVVSGEAQLKSIRSLHQQRMHFGELYRSSRELPLNIDSRQSPYSTIQRGVVS